MRSGDLPGGTNALRRPIHRDRGTRHGRRPHRSSRARRLGHRHVQPRLDVGCRIPGQVHDHERLDRRYLLGHADHRVRQPLCRHQPRIQRYDRAGDEYQLRFPRLRHGRSGQLHAQRCALRGWKRRRYGRARRSGYPRGDPHGHLVHLVVVGSGGRHGHRLPGLRRPGRGGHHQFDLGHRDGPRRRLDTHLQRDRIQRYRRICPQRHGHGRHAGRYRRQLVPLRLLLHAAGQQSTGPRRGDDRERRTQLRVRLRARAQRRRLHADLGRYRHSRR
jgi:hypothetical protein